MPTELFEQVANPRTNDTKELGQHSRNAFTLKRIPWSRRVWLLLQGKQSRKWSTTS